MVPFSRCILLWRLSRGLSQARLAGKARIPRPNISNIERGKRDVSLSTLRALAVALDVSPGTLADGIPPQDGGPPFSREILEKVASAVSKGRIPAGQKEGALVQRVLHLVQAKKRAHFNPGRGRGKIGRRSERAWLTASAQYPPAVIQSLVERVVEKRP